MRLVSSIIGSWLILSERVDEWLEWVGILMIISAISGFWLIRQYNLCDSDSMSHHEDSMGKVELSEVDQRGGDADDKMTIYAKLSMEESGHT